MIKNTTLRRAEFFAGFVALVGGLVAMPSSPYAISRALTLLQLSQCELDDRELFFPVSIHPMMNFGDFRGRYLRGAVVGNVSLLTVVFVLMLGLGLFKQTPSTQTKYDSTFGQMINTSRLPSLFGILFAVFLDGTISSSVRLARVSEVERGKDAFICLVGICTMIGFGIFLYVQLRQVRDGPKPLAYMDCEIRAENMTHDTVLRLNSPLYRYLLVGYKAWVPADEDLGTEVPPEAQRVYHLQVHYRDLDPTEGGLNRMMPYFFFYDAIITGSISFLHGLMTPCIGMLWGIMILEACAFLLVAIFKPFVVPLFNTMIALQAFALALAALLIQSGQGEEDWGRYLGEWLALAGAAFAFTPAFIMVVRTIWFWRGRAGFARFTKELDDEERAELQRRELQLAAEDRAAADAAAKEEEERRLAKLGMKPRTVTNKSKMVMVEGEGDDDDDDMVELNESGGPPPISLGSLAMVSSLARSRMRAVTQSYKDKAAKMVTAADAELLFGREEAESMMSAAKTDSEASGANFDPSVSASNYQAFGDTQWSPPPTNKSARRSSLSRRRLSSIASTREHDRLLFGTVDTQTVALAAPSVGSKEINNLFGDVLDIRKQKGHLVDDDLL